MSSGPHDETPFDADHPTGRMPFAFRAVPDPLPFEPAHAWVRRAAFMNGQPSFETLAFQLGLNPARLGPRTCLALALASDPPNPELLIGNTPVVEGHRVRFGTGSVSIKNWSISFRRYCPACLEESAHHRFFWDISFFCECPFHGIVLEGGRGRGDVTWSSTDMRFSTDGRWLPGQASVLETPLRSMEGYTLGRIGVSDGFAAPILDRSPLDEVAYCVPLLGSLLARCGEGIRHSANRLALGPQITSVGFAALVNTEGQLVEHLERRAAASLETLDPRAEAGLKTLFGRISDVFASARRMALARDILEAMRIVVGRIGRLRTRSSRLGRLVSVPAPAFGLKDLSEMTAIPVGTLRILLELGGVQKAAAGQPPPPLHG